MLRRIPKVTAVPGARASRLPVVVSVALAAAAAALIAELEQVIAGAHNAGSMSGTVGAIASPAVLLDRTPVTKIAESWSTYDNGVAVQELATTYLLADVVLMTCLAYLLWVTQGALRRVGPAGLEPTTNQPQVLVVAYLAADFAETLIATKAWPSMSAGESWIWAVGIFSAAKWVALILALLAIALGVKERLVARGKILGTQGSPG